MNTGRLSKKKREAIIARDGGQCVKCGMTLQEHLEKFGRMLTVDHIDGNGRGSSTPNNEDSNLMTLCLPCHGRKDRARRVINGGWKRPDKVGKPRNSLGRYYKV